MDNSTLKILIVEDNISYALELKMILDQMGYQIINILDNSSEALDAIFSNAPDLILMDIDINGELSGTEIGQKINHLNIPIIYITSYNDQEKYDEARQSNIAAYLIKPSNKFTIESTIDLVIQKQLDQKNQNIEKEGTETIFESSIFVRKNKTYHRVLLEDIQYIEAAGNLSILYLNDNNYISNLMLKDLSKKLPAHLFVKTHRSYMMNINYFSSISLEENTIKMENGKIIPISRRNKQALLERMNLG